MPRQHTERALSLRESTLDIAPPTVAGPHTAALKAIAHLVGLQHPACRARRLVVATEDYATPRRRDRATYGRQGVVDALHMASVHSRDHLALRTPPAVMSSALEAILRDAAASTDIGPGGRYRPFMHAQPRSFAEVTTLLTTMLPDTDPGAMRYAACRINDQPTTHGAILHPCRRWLDGSIDASVSKDRTPNLIAPSCGAGPVASAKDMETWSHLTNLGLASTRCGPKWWPRRAAARCSIQTPRTRGHAGPAVPAGSTICCSRTRTARDSCRRRRARRCTCRCESPRRY